MNLKIKFTLYKMLYRDVTGKIIVINRCDYKNDQIYYKQLFALKRDLYKQFSNTPKDININNNKKTISKTDF
uniref:Uncharacterized protein n=1 Tax=viral metagenome TaxID=1070528 RepID=A0A6C0F3X4_9ZZZZ